jgi:hypothetical protein
VFCTFIELFSQYEILWDASHFRVRCIGHIINLVAQDFLHIRDTGFEDLTNEYQELSDSELKEWANDGPIGRIHAIIVYIRRSSQRSQNFLRLSGGKHLVQDNSTRWNSYEKMISTAIRLRKHIDDYIGMYGLADLDQSILTEDDWTMLEQVQKPFFFGSDVYSNFTSLQISYDTSKKLRKPSNPISRRF